MIEINTLFITGAGSSWPYNYPTGKDLRIKICDEFTEKIAPLLAEENERKRPPPSKVNFLKNFTNVFERSTASSIDLFLARQTPKFNEIGKIAITYFILKAEHESKFHHKVNDPKQDWYSLLFERMTNSLTKPESYVRFGENNVNFITFNYDRSLEYFIYDSFIHSWFENERDFLENAKSTNTALLKKVTNFEQNEKQTKMINYIPFIFSHVYGKICNVGSEIGEPYPVDINYKKIVELSHNIRIVYERDDKNKEGIKELLKNHKRIFFLGFGFARENLEAIGIPELLTMDHQIYGTVLGFSDKKINDLKDFLTQNCSVQDQNKKVGFRQKLHLEPISCRQLLEKYL